MKRLLAGILVFALCNIESAYANDYYNYLHSDDINIVQNKISDNNLISEENNIIIKNSDDSSDMNKYTFPEDDSTYTMNLEASKNAYINNANSLPETTADIPILSNSTTNQKHNIKEADNRTFSEKHPILKSIGVGLLYGVLITGAVVAAAATTNNYHKLKLRGFLNFLGIMY